MKMLLLMDVLTLVAIAVGAGVLLTAARRRSHTNPALLLFAGLCVEIICAAAATDFLRHDEWEPYVRLAGRAVEGVAIGNFIWYLLPDDTDRTELPEGGR